MDIFVPFNTELKCLNTLTTFDDQKSFQYIQSSNHMNIFLVLLNIYSNPLSKITQFQKNKECCLVMLSCKNLDLYKQYAHTIPHKINKKHIMTCIKYNYLSTLKYILSKVQNVDVTPLIYKCVKHNRPKIMEYIISTYCKNKTITSETVYNLLNTRKLSLKCLFLLETIIDVRKYMDIIMIICDTDCIEYLDTKFKILNRNSANDMYYFACCCGNLDKIIYLEKSGLISKNNKLIIFLEAIKRNHIHVLDHLRSMYTENDMRFVIDMINYKTIKSVYTVEMYNYLINLGINMDQYKDMLVKFTMNNEKSKNLYEFITKNHKFTKSQYNCMLLIFAKNQQIDKIMKVIHDFKDNLFWINWERLFEGLLHYSNKNIIDEQHLMKFINYIYKYYTFTIDIWRTIILKCIMLKYNDLIKYIIEEHCEIIIDNNLVSTFSGKLKWRISTEEYLLTHIPGFNNDNLQSYCVSTQSFYEQIFIDAIVLNNDEIAQYMKLNYIIDDGVTRKIAHFINDKNHAIFTKYFGQECFLKMIVKRAFIKKYMIDYMDIALLLEKNGWTHKIFEYLIEKGIDFRHYVINPKRILSSNFCKTIVYLYNYCFELLQEYEYLTIPKILDVTIFDIQDLLNKLKDEDRKNFQFMNELTDFQMLLQLNHTDLMTLDFLISGGKLKDADVYEYKISSSVIKLNVFLAKRIFDATVKLNINYKILSPKYINTFMKNILLMAKKYTQFCSSDLIKTLQLHDLESLFRDTILETLEYDNMKLFGKTDEFLNLTRTTFFGASIYTCNLEKTLLSEKNIFKSKTESLRYKISDYTTNKYAVSRKLIKQFPKLFYVKNTETIDYLILQGFSREEIFNAIIGFSSTMTLLIEKVYKNYFNDLTKNFQPNCIELIEHLDKKMGCIDLLVQNYILFDTKYLKSDICHPISNLMKLHTYDVCEYLLSKNISIDNIFDMHVLSKIKKLNVLNYALNLGVNVFNNNHFLLHALCIGGKIELVNLLLKIYDDNDLKELVKYVYKYDSLDQSKVINYNKMAIWADKLQLYNAFDKIVKDYKLRNDAIVCEHIINHGYDRFKNDTELLNICKPYIYLSTICKKS